jgi:hypothetical protein
LDDLNQGLQPHNLPSADDQVFDIRASDVPVYIHVTIMACICYERIEIPNTFTRNSVKMGSKTMPLLVGLMSKTMQ